MTFVVRKHRNGWWQYHIKLRFPDGTEREERRKSPLTSFTGTEKFARDREEELMEKWRRDRQETERAPTLKDAWAEYLTYCEIQKRNADGTLEWKKTTYKAYVTKAIPESTRLDAISDSHVQALMSVVGGEPKSVNNALGVLSTFMRWAWKKGKIARLPAIEPLKVPEAAPRALVLDDYQTLLAAGRELEREGDWQPLAIALLGGDSGLRRGEMLALRVSALDFAAKRILIDASWTKKEIVTTKGKRIRVVRMGEELARLLAEHIDRRREFVFYGKRGRPATPHVIYRWFDDACARAKLTPDGKLHVLRHTFGTHLAKAKVDLHRIQKLLGHANQRTTEIYARIAAHDADEAAGELDAWREQTARKRIGNNSSATSETREKSKEMVVGELGFEPTKALRTQDTENADES